MAALVVAMAAALVTMAARASRDSWADAAGIAAQADSLRRRVSPLAEEDARVYREALDVMSAPPGDRAEQRDFAIAQALSKAADVPLEIASVAADTAALAETVAERGDQAVRGDAAVAATLAAAAARAAANLVVINLASMGDDPRVARVRRQAEEAAEAARRSLDLEI